MRRAAIALVLVKVTVLFLIWNGVSFGEFWHSDRDNSGYVTWLINSGDKS